MRWISCAISFTILSGCAAVPALPSIAGFAGAGGITLYKKATESGPKAEFVLIKIEISHYETQPVNAPVAGSKTVR